ncbi:hypothetical protein ACP275_10G151200 [Erythranthe tilingii]
MDDQEQDIGSGRSYGSEAEPARSRWTPKPEQIEILESLFNGGTVNPHKDETVRIRKMLQKFGPVGDANVFYWFQNRRSRSRRRQRQLQATLTASAAADQPQSHSHPQAGGGGGAVGHQYHQNTISTSTTSGFSGSSSSFGLGGNDYLGPNDTSNLHYQSEVFINGVATEVLKGPLNVKAMFGGDYLLFHCSGMPVDEVHDHGFLVQHGESYFLVPRHS